MAKNKVTNCRLGRVGGQAVIEGVMMKSGRNMAIASRMPDGSILVQKKKITSARQKYKVLDLPIIRGVVNFVEMMKLSYTTMDASTAVLGLEDEEPSKFEKWLAEKLHINIMTVVMVIGMNTAKSLTAGYDSRGNAISAEGIGFALPIQNVIEIANVILKEGSLVRPGIGVQIRTVDQETAAENGVPVGCRIEELTEGAPADQAGLKVGDIITKADDVTVTVNDDVVNYVRSKEVGDKVAFTVYREGEYLTITVTVGDMNRFSN